MLGPTTQLPAIFPSRRILLRDAAQAACSDETVFVIGTSGSGRTTFALSLFRRVKHSFYWITGAAALQDLSYAVLTGLCSQIPQTQHATDSPRLMIAALTAFAAREELWIFLDRAEQVDEQSAAVLAQLAAAHRIHLVVATSDQRRLPQALRQLSAMHHSHRVKMEPLDVQDATLLIEDQLGGPVTAPSVRRLLQAAGGSPLNLREMIFDAKDSKELRFAYGYWSLHPGWLPTGERLVNVVHARLSELDEPLRRVTVTLALTGKVSLTLAHLLLDHEQLNAALDAGLAVLVTLNSPAHGDRSVALSPTLPAAAVVKSLTRGEYRSRVEDLLASVATTQLTDRTHTNLALHGREVGIEPSAAALLRASFAALVTQRYSALIVLTEHLDAARYAPADFHRLLAARATAQHRTGYSEAGLQTLEHALDRSDPTVRVAAAQIHHSLGQLSRALGYLEPLPGDPPDIPALRLVVRNSEGPAENLSQLLEYSSDPGVGPDIRAQALAQYCARLAYQGQPSSALDLLIERLAAHSQWSGTTMGQSHLLVALHPVLLMEGGGQSDLIAKLLKLEQRIPLVNSARFMMARGSLELDHGHAVAARKTLSEALSLAQLHDPERIWGLIASLRARAAALLGEQERIGELLGFARDSGITSGKWYDLEAERALLPVILYTHGQKEARGHLQGLLRKARAQGQQMLQLRLLHDAWRLGLSENPDEFSFLAAGLEGEFARTLAGYATAAATLGAELDEQIRAHVAHGRVLYAAELAAYGSELALARADRGRATQLLNRSVQIVPVTTRINSPRLGRARINSQLLTDREYAACALAAQGQSNVAIAEELYLSPRTVEGHLQKSYAKLGIRDRRQLIEDSGDAAESSNV